MHCPVCTDATLVITERQNIEIDYCPKCRGVWLDRGELDKIIERTSELLDVSEGRSDQRRNTRERDYREYRDYDEGRDFESRFRKKKRRGFLGDLFEFD